MPAEQEQELTRADRRQAVDRLEAIADELGQISTWLTGLDQDKAAILLEDAYRGVFAACWALERSVRTRPEGWLGPGGGYGPGQAQPGPPGGYGGG